MEAFNELMHGPLGTLFYSVVGIIIMVVAVVIIDKCTSFSLKKEIIEDENVSLGVMFAGFFIAIAIIIAAAIV